jgi:hypothetical protein
MIQRKQEAVNLIPLEPAADENQICCILIQLPRLDQKLERRFHRTIQTCTQSNFFSWPFQTHKYLTCWLWYCLVQPQTKSIDIVHKKVYEWKDEGRVKKEPTPFFPTLFIPSLTVLPFVPFSYGHCQCFFVWGCTKLGPKAIQDGYLEPLYRGISAFFRNWESAAVSQGQDCST